MNQPSAYLRSFGLPLALVLGTSLLCASTFGSRGVIVAVLFCSVPMALLVLGLRLNTAALRTAVGGRYLPTRMAAHWGPLILVHSHHEPRLAGRGKELRVGRRLFCAGCYGIVAGTLAGDAAALAYLTWGFTPELSAVLTGVAPFAFMPIVARYSIARAMSAPLRVVANALLAGACWLLLLLTDAWLGSAAANLAVLSALALIAFARHTAASVENDAKPRGSRMVRP